jgi:hypothetical protein
MGVSAEKIKELLGNGLSNEVVATAVGVSPSYISQLMSDEVFASEVVTLRTKTLTDATSRDRSIDSLEDKLLHKYGQLVDQGMVYKPTDVLRALQVINAAKRRGTTPQQANTVNQTVVILNIPVKVVNKFKKNISGEVIEVVTPEGDQQTLVTMPSATLMRKLAEQHQGQKEYEQVRKYLPASTAETHE